MKKRIKQYWEGEAELYNLFIEKELNNSRKDEWKKIILENISNLINKKKKLNILDIGTGPGFFSIILAKEGHNVTGIDLTENMINVAKNNMLKEGLNIKFLSMDCQDLKFEDNSFDLLLCRNLTWTLDNPKKAYKEWYRVLKPGGRFLNFDANWYLHLFDKKLNEKFREHNDYILKKYNREIFSHDDQESIDSMGKQLFLSDKKRPDWDLKNMLEIGFSKVFTDLKINERLIDEVQRDINKLQPTFLVGAEK